MVPEKVVAALAYADDAVHPGQQAGSGLTIVNDGRNKIA